MQSEMMIFLEDTLKSPICGRSVFASEGQYRDSRHPSSEKRLLLFKSLLVITRTFFHSYNIISCLLCESHNAGCSREFKDGKAPCSGLQKYTI